MIDALSGVRLRERPGDYTCIDDSLESLVSLGHDIFMAPYAVGEVLPRRAVIRGQLYERFMDFIFVPVPTHRLRPEQVWVVNHARQLIIAESRGVACAVNARVRTRLMSHMSALNPSCVVEWGCGFSELTLDGVAQRVVLTDIDPLVVSYQKGRGRNCVLVSDLDRTVGPGAVDVIVAVFVFHFDIPDRHVRVMAELLRDGGTVVANVYRRDHAARRNLEETFERHGLTVARVSDTESLCRSHEYWLATRQVIHDRSLASREVESEQLAGI